MSIISGSRGAFACGAATALPATSNTNPAMAVRIFIDVPSQTILTSSAEVEKPPHAQYNHHSCLLAPAGAWYKKFRRALPFPGTALGPLSEQRRFEWLT